MAHFCVAAAAAAPPIGPRDNEALWLVWRPFGGALDRNLRAAAAAAALVVSIQFNSIHEAIGG